MKKSYEFLSKNITLDHFKEPSFFIYIFGNVLSGLLLRIYTVNNVIIFKPIIVDFLFVSIFALFGFLFSPRKRSKLFIVISIILSMILFSNTIYYQFYTSFLSITLLNQSANLSDVSDSILQLLNIKYLAYFIIPITLIIIHYFQYKRKMFIKIKQNENRKIKFTSIILMIMTLLIIIVSTMTNLEYARLKKQWNRVFIVEKLGVYVYQVSDLFLGVTSGLKASLGFDEAYHNFLEYFFVENTSDNQNNEYTNVLDGKDVYFIHYESAQSFVVDQSIEGNEITPVFNNLKSNGLYFDYFFSQQSVGTSSDSEFTLSTSLLPINKGTVFLTYADRNYNSIQKDFKNIGYDTYSFHGNNATFWNRNIMHRNLGYDLFISKNDYIIDEEIGFGLSDASFFKQSVSKIAAIKNANPDTLLMNTLITLTNHTPFDAVDMYGEFNVGHLEGTKLGNYLKSMHYADYSLGIFLEEMENHGLLDNAVVIIYGDHDANISKDDFNNYYNYDIETESFYQEGDENYTEVGGRYYRQLERVPFLIYTKDKTIKPKVVEEPMGMIDIAPTIGNMFGFDNVFSLGNDIFSVEDNYVILPDGSWIDSNFYYSASSNKYFPFNDAAFDYENLQQKTDEALKKIEISEKVIVYNLIDFYIENKKIYEMYYK